MYARIPCVYNRLQKFHVSSLPPCPPNDSYNCNITYLLNYLAHNAQGKNGEIWEIYFQESGENSWRYSFVLAMKYGFSMIMMINAIHYIYQVTEFCWKWSNDCGILYKYIQDVWRIAWQSLATSRLSHFKITSQKNWWRKLDYRFCFLTIYIVYIVNISVCISNYHIFTAPSFIGKNKNS